MRRPSLLFDSRGFLIIDSHRLFVCPLSSPTTALLAKLKPKVASRRNTHVTAVAVSASALKLLAAGTSDGIVTVWRMELLSPSAGDAEEDAAVPDVVDMFAGTSLLPRASFCFSVFNDYDVLLRSVCVCV